MSDDEDEDEDASGQEAAWSEVERLVETYIVPELVDGTFSDHELFVTVGGDVAGAVEGRPSVPDSDPALLRWAGNAFLYQMGFFRLAGEMCCEVRTGKKTRELTDMQIYQLLIERMDDMGLEPEIQADNQYVARPRVKISNRVFGRPSRSQSPACRRSEVSPKKSTYPCHAQSP